MADTKDHKGDLLPRNARRSQVLTSQVVQRHVSELDGTMKLLIRLQELSRAAVLLGHVMGIFRILHEYSDKQKRNDDDNMNVVSIMSMMIIQMITLVSNENNIM